MTETMARAARDRPGGSVAAVAPERVGPVVVVIAVAAAIGAGFAGCHPAGWAPADVFVTMALAAGLTLAAGRARPWTWAVLVAPGLLMASGWPLLVSLVAIGVVAYALWRPPARPWQGALAVGLGLQALLRLPVIHLGHSRLDPATAAIAVAAMAPLLVSAWRLAGAGARRWVRRAVVAAAVLVVAAAAGLALAAVTGRSGMQRGLLHAERGLDAAESGDQERAAGELDQSASGFAQARQRFDAPWAWPARAVPVLGHYAAAATLAADAGYHVAASAASAARQVPYDQLSPQHGQVDLDLLRSVGPPMDAAASQLQTAAAQIDALDTTWLVPPLTHRLDGLRHDLAKTVPEARRAADAVAVAPAMLGADGTRHYLLLFANPAEARPLGGYVGAYGELTASAGKLELTQSGRTADLHLPPGAVPPADPAGFEARYSAFQPESHLGNISVSPDFVAVATEAARLYGPALGVHVDGVVYVDPEGLAALLKLTGPITVDGLTEPLTEHNAADFLLRDQYTTFAARADRFDFLTEASTQTFRRLTDAKLPAPNKAFKALYPAVQSGRLRFVSFDAAESRLLDQAGLTGAFPDAGGGDLISLRSSNASPNKTDAFMHRTLRYEATVDPAAGSVDASVTVTLSNQAPLDLPAYVLGNRDLESGTPGARPYGSNTSYVTLYSPLLLQGAQLDGTDLALASQADAGVHAYTALVTVPAGGTVTLSLHVSGTIGLSGTIGPDDAYHLTIAHQPTVNDDEVTVVVHGPSGADASQQQDLTLTGDEVLTFSVSRR